MTQATLLIVEDEQSLCEMLQMLLEEAGYAVLTAARGQEALARLAETVPAAVISDVMMPGMNGYALLERIRATAAWQAIPVVFVSAIAQQRTASVQPDVYLRKPYDIAELEAVVARLVSAGA